MSDEEQEFDFDGAQEQDEEAKKEEALKGLMVR